MFLGRRVVDMLGLSNFACHPRSLHRVRAQSVLADGARLLWIMGRTSELGRIMLADYAYSVFSVLSPSESQKFVVSKYKIKYTSCLGTYRNNPAIPTSQLTLQLPKI